MRKLGRANSAAITAAAILASFENVHSDDGANPLALNPADFNSAPRGAQVAPDSLIADHQFGNNIVDSSNGSGPSAPLDASSPTDANSLDGLDAREGGAASLWAPSGDDDSQHGSGGSPTGNGKSANDDGLEGATRVHSAHLFPTSDSVLSDTPAPTFANTLSNQNNSLNSHNNDLGPTQPDHIDNSAALAPISMHNPTHVNDGDEDDDVDFILMGSNSGSGGTTSGTSTGTTSTTTTSGGTASAGLHINVTYDASVANAPAAFTTVVAAAVQWFQSHFSDPITININVGYGEVGGQTMTSFALGRSLYFVDTFSYSQVKNALAADAKSASNSASVATLPSTDPTNGGTFHVSTAEAKALGLNSGSFLDGYVGFSAGGVFDYDNTNGITAGQYDFMGTVMHEISEVLGRETMDGQSTTYYPLDLFHYSAPGVRTFSGTTAGYFPSITDKRSSINSILVLVEILAIGRASYPMMLPTRLARQA